MKLTDWCILFLVLFVCSMLPQYFNDALLQQGSVTVTEYNRIFDCAATDCMMDTVKAENEDGSIQIDTMEAKLHFYEQIAFVFDAIDENTKTTLWNGVKMEQFVNQTASDGIWKSEEEAAGLDLQQAMQLRDEMENSMNQAKRKDASLFALSFPYITGDDWYQNLKPYAFYLMYEGENITWRNGYHRYLFSGSMIKKTDED